MQMGSGHYAGPQDSANAANKVQNTIASVQLAPNKFTAATFLHRDEEEDTLLPLMDYLVGNATRRLARSIDKSILRGDGSITGVDKAPADFVSTITGVVTLAEAVAGDGLKRFTGSNTQAATVTDIANVRTATGKYGLNVSDDLVYLTTVEGHNQLVQDTNFVTRDKAGAAATLFTGMVGSVWGIPVMITEFL